MKNYIYSDSSTIAGGAHNQIQMPSGASSIGGGSQNFIQTGALGCATIAGGYSNEITGNYSAIPGGYNNTVSTDYSFAFGQEVNIPSISGNRVAAFFTDASGGAYRGKVGINNPTPHSTLQFDGSFATTVLTPTGTGDINLSTGTEGEKNFTIFANGAANSPVTLPDPGTCEGRIYVIRNISNAVGVDNVIVSTAGAGARIDYGPTWTIKKKDGIIVQSAGLYGIIPQWWVIGETNTP